MGALGVLILIGFMIWGIIKLLPYIPSVVGCVIWFPVILYDTVKSAFVKGNRLYKWRYLVVFDIVAVVVGIVLVVIEIA